MLAKIKNGPHRAAMTECGGVSASMERAKILGEQEQIAVFWSTQLKEFLQD
jgi:hypothetical protein